MVLGVGGSRFRDGTGWDEADDREVVPIGTEELLRRVEKAQGLMREQGVDALYLDTSTNLRYFTGIELKLTERLHGAVIPAEGEIAYLSPAFEEPKTRDACSRFGDDVRVLGGARGPDRAR